MRVLLLALMLSATAAVAHENDVSITREGDQLCFVSNSAPDNDIGAFPNDGNPNNFRVEEISVCVDATPEIAEHVTTETRSAGITVTGIMIRPGTVDYFDANSTRLDLRDPSSGWSLERVDAENAHADHRGLNYYRGVSDSLAMSQAQSLVGFAADGFEIHYLGDRVRSSWQLRDGTRDAAPFGAFGGEFEDDWHFVADSGDLDECNAALVDGVLTYFATDRFPFFPRCFHGTVSSDFIGRP